MSSELANEREMTAEAKREQKGLALQVQLARQSSSEAKALADDLKRELANEQALRETAHANSQRQRQELEEKALLAEAKQQQLEDELTCCSTAAVATQLIRPERSVGIKSCPQALSVSLKTKKPTASAVSLSRPLRPLPPLRNH